MSNQSTVKKPVVIRAPSSEQIAVALLKRAKELKKVLILGVVAANLAACGMHTNLPTSNGRILIDADAKGMQAFFDGQNGLITNGKATPDATSAHWTTRRQQEQEATKREYAPSFFDKLTGANVSAPPSEGDK